MHIFEIAQEKRTLKMYVKNYDRWYQIQSIFTKIQDADEYMAKNKKVGVLSISGHNIILAFLDDEGKINLDKIE